MSPDDAVVVANAVSEPATTPNTPTQTVSEARLRANRVNAQRSTGPRTQAGKDRSRMNGVIHGLSGAGVVLPEPMRAEVDRLIASYVQDLQPANDTERLLLERAALGEVRFRFAYSAESMYITQVSQRASAPEVWDQDKAAEVAELGALLPRRPSVVLPKLLGSVHGVRWLRQRWACLDGILDQAGAWDDAHKALVHALLGLPLEFLGHDPMGLSQASVAELKDLVREEMEQLDEMAEGDLATLDELDRQRHWTGAAGMFTPTFNRLWKYSRAAECMRDKAMSEFHRLRKERKEGEKEALGQAARLRSARSRSPLPSLRAGRPVSDEDVPNHADQSPSPAPTAPGAGTQPTAQPANPPRTMQPGEVMKALERLAVAHRAREAEEKERGQARGAEKESDQDPKEMREQAPRKQRE